MNKPETLRPVTEQELLEASEEVINIEKTNVGMVSNDRMFFRLLAMTKGGKYLYSCQGESVINPDDYDYEEVDE